MTPPPSLDDLVATVRQDSSTDDPLTLLSTAANTAQQLADITDALLDHFVNHCRQSGRSWSEISGALGVTKQAAHKRFAANPPTFERFTPRARRVLEVAAERCRAAGGTQVEPEHLLVALYDQPAGVAATALVALGATKADVEARLGLSGTPSGERAGAAPFSPPARSLLRDALDEALGLAHNYIGTEHLLLALVRDPASRACRALADLGVGPEAVRGKITEVLSAFDPPPAPTA